jgi:hypothetical protein
MPGHTKHPLAVAISFIDAINHGDVDRLAALMDKEYSLVIFGKAEEGRERGIEGWRGYASAYPNYLIHPHRMVVEGNRAAVLGHTTGSHLGLPDEKEEKLTLIWVADVTIEGLVRTWELLEDNPKNKRETGLGQRRKSG